MTTTSKREEIRARFNDKAAVMVASIEKTTGARVTIEPGVLDGEDLIVWSDDANAADVRAYVERNFSQVGFKVVRFDSLDGETLIAIGQ